MAKRLQLEGKKFGKLQVLSFYSLNRKQQSKFLCQCDCGNKKVILSSHLVRKTIKSCGCLSLIKGKEHRQWTGAGEISGSWWASHVKRSHKSRRKIPVTITVEEAWLLFLKQKRKCALSGITITFPKTYNDKNSTASLDRIDSNKDYSLDNVQWVHKHVNIMKNKFDLEYFKDICKKIGNNS